MERKVRCVIAYDGTDFHGWQRQADVRTVQQTLEDVACRVLGQRVHFVGASRTDAGVHAHGQVAHLVYSGSVPPDNLRRAINHRLPRDVVLRDVRAVRPTFHATRDALGKLYRYRLYNYPDPPPDAVRLRYTWQVRHPLSPDAMRAAAALLVGTHDFAAFASAGSPRESTVRTIRHVDVQRRADELHIDVAGTGFLYNQVRIMVATLVEVGRGHWPAARVAEILAARDRTQAAGVAPAAGLCLEWVHYPPELENAWSSPDESHS